MSLSDDNGLAGELTGAVDDVHVPHPTRAHGGPPLADVQKRARIGGAPRVRLEHPPPIRHSKHNLNKRKKPHGLLQQKDAGGAQQLRAVPQGRIDIRRGVKGIGRHDEVELVCTEALKARVRADVEESRLQHHELGTKALGRLA
eukprot:scaffold315452_cov27-Tisochrysis_lutea.AAC.5